MKELVRSVHYLHVNIALNIVCGAADGPEKAARNLLLEEERRAPVRGRLLARVLVPKSDAGMLVVGQSTKKRPHGMTFVRMLNYKVLDMCEVGVDDWKSMADLKVRSLFSVDGRAF